MYGKDRYFAVEHLKIEIHIRLCSVITLNVLRYCAIVLFESLLNLYMTVRLSVFFFFSTYGVYDV